VLLLDEPSSGLDEQETDALGVLLHELTAAGSAVLLSSTTCARDGGVQLHQRPRLRRVIAKGTPREIQADPSVQRAYLGTAKAAS